MTPKEIWLIRKLWIDSMENNPLAASGYKTVGFVTTELEADTIIKDGGIIEDKGWPIMGKAIVFEKQKVSLYLNS